MKSQYNRVNENQGGNDAEKFIQSDTYGRRRT